MGHIFKANANINRRMKKAIPSAARVFEEQLMKEINEDRKAHGKKPFDGPKGGMGEKQREMTVSATDPESGVFHKGERKRLRMRLIQSVTDITSFWTP